MIYKGESKYRDKPITEHFYVREIVCKDGSPTYIINSEVLEGLEKLRTILGKPIFVNSAYRTESYNKKVGGSPRSQHLLGNAIDFHVKGLTSGQVYDIMKQNKMLGTAFKGVGLYDSFVHVDVRSSGYAFWDLRKK